MSHIGERCRQNEGCARSRLFHNHSSAKKRNEDINMKAHLVTAQVILFLSALFAIRGSFALNAPSQVRGAKTTLERPHRRRLPKRKCESLRVTFEYSRHTRVLIYFAELSGPSSSQSHSTNHSGYLGCLGLTDSELQSSWKFSGRAPKCQYTHHAGKGNSTSNGSSTANDNNNTISEVDEETQEVDDDGRESDSHSESTDEDHVLDNGDFDNVNESDGNEGNTDNSENDGNADNGENGGNQGNGDNGSNQANEDNGGNQGNSYGESDNSQNGKNSGNNNGQNQGQTDNDPYDDFDISRCDTYENLWLWDLSLTCETEGDPSSCECIFAEEMIELGSLNCEDAMSCPRNCPVCSRCMQLLGCQVPTYSSSFMGSGGHFYLLAVAFGLLICGSVYYARRRKTRGPSSLQKVLLDDNNSSSDESSYNGHVWLAPQASTRDLEDTGIYPYNNAAQLPIWVPPGRNTDEQPVWLAPDAFSQQLEKSAVGNENNERLAWLASDSSSIQLKSFIVDNENKFTEDHHVWLAPDASSEQLGKPNVKNELNKKPAERPVPLDSPSVPVQQLTPRVESVDSRESYDTPVSLASAEDTSIQFSFSVSTASDKQSPAPLVKNETGMISQETGSSDVEGENLPALT